MTDTLDLCKFIHKIVKFVLMKPAGCKYWVGGGVVGDGR